MVSKNFTVEEIKEVFQALSYERNRARQYSEELEVLRQQLVDQKNPGFPAEMLDQFKKLLKAYKQKQEDSKAEVTQRQHLENQLVAANQRIQELTGASQGQGANESTYQQALEESQQHADQLERVLQVLRQKAEELRLDNEQLQRELQARHELYEQAVRDHSKLTAEFKALQEMHQKQANELGELQASSSDEDISSLNKQLEEKTLFLRSIEGEYAAIKLNLVKGMRDAKELEQRFLDAVKEKVDAVSQYNQLQSVVDKKRQEIEYLKAQCHALQERETHGRLQSDKELTESTKAREQLRSLLDSSEMEKNRIHSENALLQAHLVKAQAELDELRISCAFMETEHQNFDKILYEKEIINKDLIERLSNSDEERIRFREDLKAYQHALDERSAQFAEAQQHLAKKVREVSTLEAKLEELSDHLNASAALQSETETLYNQAQDLLQVHLDEKSKLQEELSFLKSQESVWEQRYSDVEAKWKSALQQIAILEKVREKHQQLQAMISNFGDVFDVQDTKNSFSGPPSIEKPAKQALKFGSESGFNSNDEDSSPTPERPYQNLFDVKKTQQPGKQDLFE